MAKESSSFSLGNAFKEPMCRCFSCIGKNYLSITLDGKRQKKEKSPPR
jgi:hypothetical protein